VRNKQKLKCHKKWRRKTLGSRRKKAIIKCFLLWIAFLIG
jgi:hypothetical protein